MLYGYDLLGKFSSVEELQRDDAFAESVLGSQGNKEEFGTFCFGDAFWWMKGTNGKITCDRGIACEGEDDREISRR